MVQKKKEGFSFKKIILMIAIAVLLAFFVGYLVESLYPSPQYYDYCNESIYSNFINSSEECIAVGGQWNEFEKASGWCNAEYTCMKEYNDVNAVYERNAFIVLLVLGLICVGVSFAIRVWPVSVGVMAGGVLLLIYSTMRYWGILGRFWRVGMLGLALGILIWIGYKKFK